MASSRNIVGAANTVSKIRNEVDKKIRQTEVSSTIRESRGGFRGFGLFQLSKYYSSEGVHVIDIGGPPLVGR